MLQEYIIFILTYIYIQLIIVMSDEEVEIVLGMGEYQKLKENAESYVKGMIVILCLIIVI